jgi:hypothetical protein
VLAGAAAPCAFRAAAVVYVGPGGGACGAGLRQRAWYGHRRVIVGWGVHIWSTRGSCHGAPARLMGWGGFRHNSALRAAMPLPVVNAEHGRAPQLCSLMKLEPSCGPQACVLGLTILLPLVHCIVSDFSFSSHDPPSRPRWLRWHTVRDTQTYAHTHARTRSCSRAWALATTRPSRQRWRS